MCNSSYHKQRLEIWRESARNLIIYVYIDKMQLLYYMGVMFVNLYAEYVRFGFHTVPSSPTDVSVQPLYRVDGSIQYVDVGFNGVVSFNKLMHTCSLCTHIYSNNNHFEKVKR